MVYRSELVPRLNEHLWFLKLFLFKAMKNYWFLCSKLYYTVWGVKIKIFGGPVGQRRPREETLKEV